MAQYRWPLFHTLLQPIQSFSTPTTTLYKSLLDTIKQDPASTDSWLSGYVSPQWLGVEVWISGRCCSPFSSASGKVQQVWLYLALSAREPIRWLFLIDLLLLVHCLPFPHLHNPGGRGILNGLLLEKILFLGMPSLRSLLKWPSLLQL